MGGPCSDRRHPAVISEADRDGVTMRSATAGAPLSLLAALPLLCLAPQASAQGLRSFCAAAEKPVRADAHLSEAVQAAFGSVSFTSKDEECIFPLKVLRYASADVLLTQGTPPGDACHGCAAHLSAYVLRRSDGGLKLVKRLPDFAEAGTFGDAGDLASVTIGGDDGLAIESGGTFQGYSYVTLDLYVFRSGRVLHLAADPPVFLSADNGGAMVDDSEAASVTGSWSISPAPKTDLSVDYKVKARGRTRVERVVWTLQGARLVLTKGRVPPEVKEASGGG